MIALTGATVFTMCGSTLKKAVIVVKKGKIAAVGQDVAIPKNAEIIDATGKIITPGLIDAHTHLGIYGEAMAWAGEDGNEMTDPVTPGLRTLDAINPADIGFSEAYRGGITTVMIAPGSANAIGGQCIIAKTKPKAIIDDMIVSDKAGLKIAFGENPKRVYGTGHKKSPMTRMATANLIREAFYKAQHYLKTQQKEEKCVDLGLEALVRVLRKEMPLRAHAHRADDIVTAIRIAKEFAVDIIIEHGTESYQVAELLAKENIPVIVGPTLTTRSKMELKDKNMATPAMLLSQGVLCAMMSDHPVIPSCFLPVYAGLATRFGLSDEEGLQLITSHPAQILGLQDRIGSIAPGRDADLVIWSGHPFYLGSRPELVMVDGIAERLD